MMQERRLGVYLLVLVATTWSCLGTDPSPASRSNQIGIPNSSNMEGFDKMSLSEVTPFKLSNGKGSISLGTEGDETHLLVINASSTQTASFTLQLSDTSLPTLETLTMALETEPDDDPEEAIFHQYLLEMGQGMAASGDHMLVERSALATLKQEPKLGDTRDFKVLTSMTSVAKCKTVTAELRAVTPTLYIYVDNDAAEALDAENIEALVSSFDGISIPRERRFFGTESDIDEDSHVTTLMTGTVNGMATSGGIVTGFFFPADLYAVSSSNPCSNEMEVFYTLVPDPKGKYGIPISEEFAMGNILPGVLCHEYQHMISFNNHVYNGSGRTEDPWLNEAISHLSEDLCGRGNENPSRVKLYLDNPNATSLVPSTSPNLAERGGGYLLLRYLCDQQADDCTTLLQCLLEGELTGTKNVESCTAQEFSDLMNDFSIAVALAGTGIATSDLKYSFDPRGTDPDTGTPTGICLRCDANDGRGTLLNGPAIAEVSSFPVTVNLKSSASQYFLIQDAPTSVSINSVGGPTLSGSVLRLK